MWDSLRKRRELFDEPNEYKILRLARDSDVISRVEISRACQLSKPTVSDIVSRFLKGGFLEEVGESPSTARGGRKRILLRFNPQAGFVIGVEVRMTACRVAISDINANILQRESFTYSAGSAPQEVLTKIFVAVEDIASSHPQYLDRGVGIGIGLPGVIDRSTGLLKFADTLKGWEHVDLRRAFEERFSLETYVENDVKARALAEFLFGSGKNVMDQVYLWVGDGIGAGIIVDGKLHHGVAESAGEIGYNELGHAIKDPAAFPILYCGQRDFGDILSDSVILNQFRSRVDKPSVSSVADICKAAGEGHPLAKQLLNEIASLVSIVCINLMNVLNPELIVVGGQIAEYGPELFEDIQKKVRQDILSVPADSVRIVPALLKQDAVILGAVGLVLHDLFEPVRENSYRIAALQHD